MGFGLWPIGDSPSPRACCKSIEKKAIKTKSPSVFGFPPYLLERDTDASR